MQNSVWTLVGLVSWKIQLYNIPSEGCGCEMWALKKMWSILGPQMTATYCDYAYLKLFLSVKTGFTECLRFLFSNPANIFGVKLHHNHQLLRINLSQLRQPKMDKPTDTISVLYSEIYWRTIYNISHQNRKRKHIDSERICLFPPCFVWLANGDSPKNSRKTLQRLGPLSMFLVGVTPIPSSEVQS